MDDRTEAPLGTSDRPAAHSSAAHPAADHVPPFTHHAGSPAFLVLTALGVVFGDIGTSPLYAFQVALSGLGHPNPTAPEVTGIVSLILWALMVMVSLKYVTLVLRADNEGEGGILALLSLVAAGRVANGARLPLLVLLGVIGAALLYGDGVITPAISVLSAMEGLKLVAPGFEHFIVPATLAILIGLFVIQRYGTGRIGKLFGPVMVAWFVVIGILGAINVVKAPAILHAINPLEAGRFLAADPLISFAVIGAVFLALTGGEALYADMGHVGATAIRRAWYGLVLPALMLNYFGQGALILADPAAADNPFYKLLPGWALIPMVALAALATVIASQALISGVFSLTRQAMQMGLSPRANIISTSGNEAGQIYVPAANWMLMAGTLFTVLLFRSSENLAAAYGIAVSGTMLITTILLYRVGGVALGLAAVPVAIPVIAAFAAIDSVISGFQFDQDRRGRLVSFDRRRRHRRPDAVLAQGLVRSPQAPARDVDAARPVPALCRQRGDRPCARARGVVDQSRSRRFADAAAPYRAQPRAAREGGAADLRLGPPAARSLRRTPLGAAPRPRFLPDPGASRLHADPGYSAIPAQLQPARLRRRPRAPELLRGARNRGPPRYQVGDGTGIVPDLLVPQPHLQPRPGFFQDPA